MATSNAAKLLGRAGEIGTLKLDHPAELSVLKIAEREWQAVDSQKGTIPAHQAITPVYAIRGEMIHAALPAQRP
jgi:dihydroorotase